MRTHLVHATSAVGVKDPSVSMRARIAAQRWAALLSSKEVRSSLTDGDRVSAYCAKTALPSAAPHRLNSPPLTTTGVSVALSPAPEPLGSAVSICMRVTSTLLRVSCGGGGACGETEIEGRRDRAIGNGAASAACELL